MASFSRFVFSLYYWVNLLVPIAYALYIYPPYRGQSTPALRVGFSGSFTNEQETCALIAFSYLLKMRSHATADESVQKFFMMGKVLTIVLTLLVNQRRNAILLTLAYCVM